jgi:AbrB family looped-hinge helix DNA binding protein
MEAVTVSPKFQVVIPAPIRKAMNITPGQKMQVLQVGDRIEFVPVRELKKMRGFLKGIDTRVPREGDRV